MSEQSITMRECLMRDLQDQRDFAMSEMERLKRERDEANAARKASAADWLNQVENMSKCVAAAKKKAVSAEKERDEAREFFAIATAHCVDAQQELRTARNLADGAMWEADRLRSKLCRSCDREEKLVSERNEAWKSLHEAAQLLMKINILTDQ